MAVHACACGRPGWARGPRCGDFREQERRAVLAVLLRAQGERAAGGRLLGVQGRGEPGRRGGVVRKLRAAVRFTEFRIVLTGAIRNSSRI